MKTLSIELELALNERPVIETKGELYKSFKKIENFHDIKGYYKSGENARPSSDELRKIKQIASAIDNGKTFKLKDKTTIDLLLSLSYDRLRKNAGMHSEGLSLEKQIELNAKKYSKNTYVSLNNLDFDSYNSTKTRIYRGGDKGGIGVQVFIPKDDTSLRELIISSTVDRWVQGALELPFKIKYERERDIRSYGYIRKVSKEQVIMDGIKSDVLYKNSTKYIIEADVKNCFPSIPHDIILKKAEEYDSANYSKGMIGYKLLKAMLKTGYLTTDGKYIKPTIGTPQGNVGSPVLANMVMSIVDDGVEAKNIEVYARFADDFIIGCKTIDEALSIRSELTNFVYNEMGLILNTEKTVITNGSEKPISFLGYNITYKLSNKELDIMPDIKRRLKSLKQKLIISSDSTPNDIRFIETYRGLSKSDKMDKLFEMGTPIFNANKGSNCETIINDIISKHYMHALSKEDWDSQVKQEEILHNINLAQLIPHLCITKNAYHLKYNNEMNDLLIMQDKPVKLKSEVLSLIKNGSGLPIALEKCALSGGSRPRIIMHKENIDNKVIEFLADNVQGSFIFDTDEYSMNYLILSSTKISYDKRTMTKNEVLKMLSTILNLDFNDCSNHTSVKRFYNILLNKISIKIDTKFIIGTNFVCYDSEGLKSIHKFLISDVYHSKVKGVELHNQFFTGYHLISFILHFAISVKRSD